MASKKYEVTIKEAKGTCDSELFRLMAEEGDLNATKIKDLMGATVEITGYAIVHITTDNKDFELTYINTEEYELISAGSQIFTESLIKYFDKGIRNFVIKEIKTKKGMTYKATPVLKTDKKEETTQEETGNDLPF